MCQVQPSMGCVEEQQWGLTEESLVLGLRVERVLRTAGVPQVTLQAQHWRLGSSPLSPVHVFKDIALVVFKGQLEGQCCVVALQHSGVIVQHGQLIACVAEE